MLKELKKNKMSVVATGILFGVMGVLIIPMISVIVKISNALSQKHPRIYKYSMIAFIGMLLAISLFCVVIKHQMSYLTYCRIFDYNKHNKRAKIRYNVVQIWRKIWKSVQNSKGCYSLVCVVWKTEREFVMKK